MQSLSNSLPFEGKVTGWDQELIDSSTSSISDDLYYSIIAMLWQA